MREFELTENHLEQTILDDVTTFVFNAWFKKEEKIVVDLDEFYDFYDNKFQDKLKDMITDLVNHTHSIKK